MYETEQLREACARLVAAADEERRQIERDLHDGPQQQFVALAVNLELARQLAGAGPAELRDLLDELGRDVRAALEEVREIAERVYPPLLVERGLCESLRAHARVEGSLAERYPPEVEATVFFCCAAALRGAPGATVRLWAQDGELRFEVRGGCGDVTAARDRVAALGGRLEVAGDRISGAVPS